LVVLLVLVVSVAVMMAEPPSTMREGIMPIPNKKASEWQLWQLESKRRMKTGGRRWRGTA
jgi:hypothetical protein